MGETVGTRSVGPGGRQEWQQAVCPIKECNSLVAAGGTGAGRGGRTLTSRSPRDFESRASASSAIPAGDIHRLAAAQTMPLRHRFSWHLLTVAIWCSPRAHRPPIDDDEDARHEDRVPPGSLGAGSRRPRVAFVPRRSTLAQREAVGVAGADFGVEMVQLDTGGDPGCRGGDGARGGSRSGLRGGRRRAVLGGAARGRAHPRGKPACPR